jgi:uncharacterized membrane-anchored protein YhcB (DUF1043 family)
MDSTPGPEFGLLDEQSTPRSWAWVPKVLLATVLVIGIAEGIYAWNLSGRLAKVQGDLQTQLAQQDDQMRRLRDRLGMADEQYSQLQGDLTATQDHLTKAVGEVRKTQQLATQVQKQTQESTGQLNNQLGELQQDQQSTRGAVGTLSSDLTGVRHEVGTTREELASTRSELQRVIGDLGAQSDLVARNRTELGELRARGERDYFEFDLRKAKQAQRLGPVALQLKKTDVKRQKYTVNLVADDRTIEKKDKNVNEPVQFYQQGQRQATEIVVNQIYKDRIVGYISVPKQAGTQVSGLENEAGQTGSGS